MSKEKKLKSSIIHGFSTLIVREFFLKILSFLGQVILARILSPSDFGMYVIIVFIITIISLFTDIGLSQAIIQKKKEPTIQELSGVFWLKGVLSLIFIILIWFCAPLIAMFYTRFNEQNILMLRIFSVTLLLSSLRTIPISLFERKLRYNLISLLDVIGVIVYYIVTLMFALLHFGVWSFIWGAVLKEGVETAIIYSIQPFIPQFIDFRNSIKKMVKFGIYIQGNGLVSFFISSFAPALGGRTSGPYAVGLLDFAYSLVSIPAVVSINFGRVSFAGYSRMQGNKDQLSKSINKSVSMLAIVLYIFPVIFIGFGRDLIHFIYTDKWISAVPALYLYSLSVFFFPTLTPLGQIILSIGKSKEIFWYTLSVTFVASVSALLFIKVFGFTGIALANVMVYIGLYLSYIVILKKYKYKFSAIYILFPKLAATCCSLLVALVLNSILPSNLLFLIVKLILGTIFYIFFMLLFVRQDTVELFQLGMTVLRLKRL
jgi:teichuronic acid exporter